MSYRCHTKQLNVIHLYDTGGGNVRFSVRLSEQDDKDLITWLQTLENKSQGIKEMLRVGLSGHTTEHPEKNVVENSDLIEKVEGMFAELKETLNLSMFRRVIEVALGEKLSGLSVTNEITEEEDKEVGQKIIEMFDDF